MSRPPLEVADLIRAAGAAFIERNRHWLSWKHIKVLPAIARCRTAALGGHLDRVHPLRASRHLLQLLPQSALPEVSDRGAGTLDRRTSTRTSPDPLRPCGLHASSASWRHWPCRTRKSSTIYCSAPVRKLCSKSLAIRRHLGAEIGFFSVLHTWNQKLGLHPHVHCVIPAGGLSLDHTHWIKSRDRFFLPIHVLRRVFRGKFVAGSPAGLP